MIFCACDLSSGYQDVLKLLIPCEMGRTALFAAAEEGNVEVVQAFLSHGVDVNAIDQDGWNALFAAAEEGNVEVVQALVNCGVDVNVTDQVVCVCVFVCVCVALR